MWKLPSLLRILITIGVLGSTVGVGFAANTRSTDVMPVVTHFLLTGEQSPPVAVDPDISIWTPTRNSDGDVIVTTSGTAQTFEYELGGARILTGFPIGHGLPAVSNQLFYNLFLDGYGGLPFGSCLRRGYLLAAEQGFDAGLGK